MAKLQILQNKAAKIILGRPLFSSASDALHELGWKPLFYRRFYHRCSYVFKCLNNLALYNRDNKLRLPSVTRNCGKYKVSYHAISDWNSLDDEIITSDTFSKFKSHLLKCSY